MNEHVEAVIKELSRKRTLLDNLIEQLRGIPWAPGVLDNGVAVSDGSDGSDRLKPALRTREGRPVVKRGRPAAEASDLDRAAEKCKWPISAKVLSVAAGVPVKQASNYLYNRARIGLLERAGYGLYAKAGKGGSRQSQGEKLLSEIHRELEQGDAA